MRKKNIKILVISDYRPTTSVRPEAEIFIGLAKAGFDIHIMTYGDCEYAALFKAVGIRVIDFHPQKKLDPKEIRFIKKELIDGKYDAIHLFNSIAILNGIQAAKKLLIKIILYRGFEGHIHWYDPTAYFKYLHPRVDYITCNSKGVEDYFKNILFFKKEKAVTINKGHDLNWYKDIIPKERKEMGFSENDFLIICVANNRKMKGMEYLFSAMDYLPKNLAIHLLIVGNGMENNDLNSIKNRSSYKENIHTLGFRKDALELVAMSDVFALASLFGESITKGVLEAMSLGIAPLITDIPGNQELVIHEKNGLVVPIKNPNAIADGISRLYSNRKETLDFGFQSQQRIRDVLSSERAILGMKAFYEEILCLENMR